MNPSVRTFLLRASSKQVEKRKSIGGTTEELQVSGTPEREGSEVRLAVNGDQRAFERLYRAHHGRVFSLAIRMAGTEWAEDLTQEVFIRVWQKLGTFRGDAKFGTWLHRLAVNHILSRRESLRKRQGRIAGGEGILSRLTASRQRRSGVVLDLEMALGRLPDGARQIFVLYDVEGYGHDEIAELAGISVGTSKSQLHRARMLLRGHLNA